MVFPLAPGFVKRPVFWITLSLLFVAIPLHAQDAVAPIASSTPSIPFGGHHEFGVLAGYSAFSGPVWGFSRNVHYSPTVLRYSFLIRNRKAWTLRYAPELTALSVMDEFGPPDDVDPRAPITHYGAGFSPEGFQIVLRPRQRVQPFLSNAAGIIYYNGRVLSPQGSQFMFTIDFGAGVNLFTSSRNAIQLGYRYQHLSNANISVHNPGTDADTFYIGFSHFHTKGVR